MLSTKTSQLERVTFRQIRTVGGVGGEEACNLVEFLGGSSRVTRHARHPLTLLETHHQTRHDDQDGVTYIVCSHSQFVTHSNSQLLLNKELYRGVPWLERKSLWLLCPSWALIMVVSLAMPVFRFINFFLSPSHQLSRLVSSPLMKYLTSCCSYTVFLGLLIYSAFQPMKDYLTFSVVGEFSSCLNDLSHGYYVLAVCLACNSCSLLWSGPGFSKHD